MKNEAILPTNSVLFSTPISSAERNHAREIFSIVDTDNSDTICCDELGSMLNMLDIDASESEVEALFKYLDMNGDGEICFEDFSPWYDSARTAAELEATTIRDIILARRTTNKFDETPISDEVLRRAILCAIQAPNHGMTEPWRFIKLGKKSIDKISELNSRALFEAGKKKKAKLKMKRWKSIPGWCVVTSKLNDDDKIREEEDYAATCCAIQNFMLSMHGDGVGTKWTSGPITRTQEFAELCGVDKTQEKIVGCLWYGFSSGGLNHNPTVPRKKSVDDVLSERP